MARLVIALVNSMPGEAQRQTEQQFGGILAATGRDVELRFYSLDAERPPHYQDSAALRGAPPDGLIVTGMPPRAASLADEPYWPKLTELVDFAVDAGVPSVWSCLAAHAAVLYLDGIERQRLPRKLSAVVDCTQSGGDDPAMAGLPAHWRMPHSRYNDLPEAVLAARGYRILSRIDAGGADIFAKTEGAPLLFCQGHPEYDADTLLREYRRDVRQFLMGEREAYPMIPENCFGAEVAARLENFREQALRERRAGLLEAFPMAACAKDVRHTWRDVAVGLYANWLGMLADGKHGTAPAHAARVARHAVPVA
jgi:homoserine O-succinyltransferase/O-acetyltransferase